MADQSNVPGVSGNTYGVYVDLNAGTVTISDEIITTDKKAASLFAMGYRLGREHKKKEIRKALSL